MRDDRERLQRMLATLAEFNARTGENSEGGGSVRLDGLSAAITPVAPGRSVFNSVIYEDPAAVGPALGELATAYADAGVWAWTVWVPGEDAEVRRVLAAAGHRLDGEPRSMVLELGELADFEAGELDWDRTQDAELVGLTGGRGFGFDAPTKGDGPPPMRGNPLAGIADAGGQCYLARHDGEPAATVVIYDHEGDAGVYWVATVPDARGRGLCRGLMSRALLDARDRGCETASLQATKMGAPVYADLGFRDLGVIEMWERRSEPPGPTA